MDHQQEMRNEMKRILLIAAICVQAHFVVADDPEIKLTSDEQQFKEFMLQHSKLVIITLEKAMVENKQRLADGMISAQVFRQDMNFLQEKLNRYRKQPYQVPLKHLWDLKVGDIARLTGNLSGENDNDQNRFKVYEVLDDKNMLIESHDKGTAVDEANVAIRRVQVTVLVSGVSTSGITDDTYVRFDQIFQVKGTKKVRSNPVFEITPFSIQSVQSFVEKLTSLDKPAASKDLPTKSNEVSAEQVFEFLKKHPEGATTNEIAEALGTSNAFIQAKLKQMSDQVEKKLDGGRLKYTAKEE